MGGDVLHVAHVLVAALDLEAADAGVDQRAQVGALVVVLHRQQMLVVGDDTALCVFQRVGQAALLRAATTIGAAPGMRLADVAIARERYAQRAVNKVFERHIRVDSRAHLANLRDGEFTRQHQLRKADFTEEFRLFDGADVTLRRGMQRDWRNVEFEDAHVLHDQGIDAGVVELVNELACDLQLTVVQDGVDGGEDACAVAMRKFNQTSNVGYRIFRLVAGTERRATDVHRVGAVQHRFAADIGVTGGGEQFEVVGRETHGGQIQRYNRAKRVFSRRSGTGAAG